MLPSRSTIPIAGPIERAGSTTQSKNSQPDGQLDHGRHELIAADEFLSLTSKTTLPVRALDTASAPSAPPNTRCCPLGTAHRRGRRLNRRKLSAIRERSTAAVGSGLRCLARSYLFL